MHKDAHSYFSFLEFAGTFVLSHPSFHPNFHVHFTKKYICLMFTSLIYIELCS